MLLRFLLISAFLTFAACRSTDSQNRSSETATDSASDPTLDQQTDSPDQIPMSMWSPSQRKANASYFFLLSEMLQLRGEGKKALSYLESAYNLDPNPLVGAKYIAAKATFGERKEALLEARRMTLLYPKNFELFFIYGTLLIAEGETEKGIQALKKTIQLDPKNETAYVQLAGVYQRDKKNKEAIAIAKQLIKQNPTALSGWTLLSRLYLISNERKLALEPAKRAYEIQGTNPEIVLIYAIALEFNNKSKDAVQLYEQLYRLNPTNEQLINRMVELYHQFGNLEDALSILDEALQRSEKPLPALSMQKAIVLWELKRFDEASKLLIDLADKNPESDRLQYMAALSYEREKKLTEALQRYEKVPNESSLRIHSDFRSALIYREKKDFENAERYANAVINHPDTDQDAFVLLAGIKADQEKFRDAISTLKTGYEKFPDKHRLLFMIGVYQERKGDISDSVDTMKKVIKVDPQNSSAFNYLGYMYAERGENLDEAEKLILKALQLKPNDGFYMDSLGWVYYQRKNYPKALATLEEALKLSPDEGVILEHLGDVYQAMNQTDKAQEYFRNAASKDLERKDRERIEKKVKSKG